MVVGRKPSRGRFASESMSSTRPTTATLVRPSSMFALVSSYDRQMTNLRRTDQWSESARRNDGPPRLYENAESNHPMDADWSERPLRIIQTNLQVRDTDAINADRIAQQIDDLGGNALVFNVGGIYAWYDTDVTHHRPNPHLPDGRNLVGEVIDACHEHNIAFIGRVDFSKADDRVYAQRPEWFARDTDGNAAPIGAERPGGWPILRSTCVNSDYRKEAVAIPVIEELLERYDMDGIFYNAPQYVRCHCDNCRRRYERTYNEPFPEAADEFQDEWPEHCVRENMAQRYELINDIAPDVEMILYYDSHGRNLTQRSATTDLLCTESQNVLSRGHQGLPDRWKPARTMKIANSQPDGPPPVGIIHACPGMDWRHIGIPPAEYAYWVSQIPANNGHVWHTLTGVPDTIADNRIFDVVSTVNERTAAVASQMETAQSAARCVLLWDRSTASRALLDGLTHGGIPFDLLLPAQVDASRLHDYELVIVPATWEDADETIDAITEYVRDGGRLLIEGDLPDDAVELATVLGVDGNTVAGDDLVASYARFETPPEHPFRTGLKETDLLGHRGPVHYCEASTDASVLMTLVPQWSPLEAVGRPPERASIPVEHTDTPMAIVGPSEQTLYFPFALSELLDEFRLADQYQLLRNAVDLLLADEKFIEVEPTAALQVTPFAVEDGYLVHVVNGVGSRPLTENTPLQSVDIRMKAGNDVSSVHAVFDDHELSFDQEGEYISFSIPLVDVWEAISIEHRT